MIRYLFAVAICATASHALAHDVPGVVNVDVTLSPGDQNGIVAICALAMRSPAITSFDETITIGEFCARLRNSINTARSRPPVPPPQAEKAVPK